MNLSEVGGSGVGSGGVELDDETIVWRPTTGTSKPPSYKSTALGNLNLTANLTDAINIKIPDGKKAILLSAAISTIEPAEIKLQLEIDGILRVNEASFNQPAGYGISLVGQGVDRYLTPLTGSNVDNSPINISNIVFRDRLIIRVSGPSTAKAIVSVTYILVKG